MKKHFKQLLAAVIAMMMLLMAVPVSAANTQVKNKTVTTAHTYIKTADHLFWWYYGQEAWNESPVPVKDGTLAMKLVNNNVIFTDALLGDLKGNPSSSNKKVLTATRNESGSLSVRIKKTGKSVVSYSARDYDTKITYKVKDTFRVYNYKNPVKSFKIGKTQLASQFNSSPFCSQKKGLKGKLSVTANKGWKIVSIRQHRKTLALDGMMGKNYTKLSRGKNADASKGSIEVTFYNTTNKYYTSIILGQTPEGNFSDNVQ